MLGLMTWIVSLKVPSGNLLMTLNWVVRTLWKEETSYRETGTGWKSGQARTVWSLTKSSAVSYIWHDITKECSRGWDLWGWEQPCWPGGLLANKVGMSQGTAAATKADWVLGCFYRGVSSGVGDVIIPLSADRPVCIGGCPVLVPAIQGEF